jgi:hydroxymethylbilane synthase
VAAKTKGTAKVAPEYRRCVLQLRLATRGSEQARAQSSLVAERLRRHGHQVELVLVETSGDVNRDRPIWEIGGRGVFVKEVQRAVLDGRADLAVHSAKDLPSSLPTEGLVLASVPKRGDPRDALVGSTLAGLKQGATIATGSRRRQAQLAHLRPDLQFVGLRGNIPRRVARADDSDVDAVVVAVAGIELVGLADRIAHTFEPVDMVPQVGQGALAIECRSDDAEVMAALLKLEDPGSRRMVDTERSFLARLGGGCEMPVGAYAVPHGNRISVTGLVASVDGAQLYRDTIIGDQPSIGAQLADHLLALGAGQLIDRHR